MKGGRHRRRLSWKVLDHILPNVSHISTLPLL